MATVRISTARARVVGLEAARRLVTQVMYEVEFEAKIITAIGPYSAGILSESIHRNGPVVSGYLVRGSVGSSLKYARAVHSGARVHAIFPKAAGHFYRFGRGHGRPQLKFFWRKAGKVVYLPQIPGSPGKIGFSHPGVKGKHYLSEPLRNAARRHGMRYTSHDI
jgi:hypothetical protein